MATPIPKTPVRYFGWFGGALAVGAIGLALIPGVGPMFSHLVDRFRFRLNRNQELQARAEWMRNQVGAQLGMNPENVSKNDLLLAAQMNPQLKQVVKEVDTKEADDNRSSLFTTAGAAAASFIPGGGAVVKTAATLGGAVGGTALAAMMAKDKPQAQDVAEALSEHVAQAQQTGADARSTANPQLVFALRVAQSDALADAIQSNYGKAFHKMEAAEQQVVMQAYPELAQSAEAEAHAVATGVMPVQELLAAPPSGTAFSSRVARRSLDTSFVAQIEADRAAKARSVANMPAV